VDDRQFGYNTELPTKKHIASRTLKLMQALRIGESSGGSGLMMFQGTCSFLLYRVLKMVMTTVGGVRKSKELVGVGVVVREELGRTPDLLRQVKQQHPPVKKPSRNQSIKPGESITR
jgi:hypothetical protein